MGDKYTALSWMMPQLARSGLVVNEGWVERQATAACELYPDKSLHPLAMLLAVMHPHALDYLRQAPILVLGVRGRDGYGKKFPTVRAQMLAVRFGPLIRKGTKLKALMREFGLPLQMRQVHACHIDSDRTNLFLDRLALMLSPSELAQAIPEDADAQSSWIAAIEAFDDRARSRVQMRAMGREAYAERFAWAAPALARAIAAGETVDDAGDMVDFLVSPGRPFNPRWSWLQARERSQTWHRDHAAEQAENLRLGFSPDKLFDFAPFPLEANVMGLDFVALRSVLELREEGRRMRHCVGGYHAELAHGHRFYSIRRDGQRLATAQLVETTAVQVKGPLNAKPKAEVIRALGKFLGDVAGEEVAVNLPADDDAADLPGEDGE